MAGRPRYAQMLQLRADLWRVPFAMSVAAILFFVLTVMVDRDVARGTLHLPWWLSVGGPDDARAILGAMIGAVSTVLALIFSVSLLVLTMAASQLGPRMLARFVRDGVTQVTIGLFLASFVYTFLSFVVMRQLPGRLFVPQLTLCCGVVMVMASFGFLVVFTHRIAMSIQTQNVVARIVGELHSVVRELMTGEHRLPLRPMTPAAEAEREALLSRCAAEGGALPAASTGFVQEVDVPGLLTAADREDVLIRLLHRPGQFVMEGAALCQVLPAGRAPAVAAAVRRGMKIGPQRTLTQDIEFSIAQLVEIALRALSPAINDAFTVLTCIDWLGDELRLLDGILTPGLQAGLGVDDSGRVRLLWPPLRMGRITKTAFNQIRQAAKGNPAVTIRLLQTFAKLAEQAEGADFREALTQQVEAVWESASTQELVKADRADIEAAYRAAREAFGAR